MKQPVNLLLLIACLLGAWPALAAITISFPTSRAVFQRSNANVATFRVLGTYDQRVDQIQARMVSRQGGTTTAFVVIQQNPLGGVYAGDLANITGGWYDLEVKGFLAGTEVTSIKVERIGVGEVFVIGGQSNAQGVIESGLPAADDRVSCIFGPAKNSSPADFSYPVFQQLGPNVQIVAPMGVRPYYWGRLGDQLVQRLGVPVLFINAAYGGTTARNWRESAEFGSTFNAYVGGVLEQSNPGAPYSNLRLAFNFYANMLGVRAILWHHGEADNFHNTPANEYIDNMKYVINRTRQDYGRDISWVFSRASYDFDILRPARKRITDAQDELIKTVPNVFAGPNTDNIQVPRTRPGIDQPHFDNGSLPDVANAWDAALSGTFLAASTPYPATLPPTISVACAPNNNLTYTVAGQFASVRWNTGDTGPSVTKGPGQTYQATVKDALGNALFSTMVRVPDAPTAAISGPTTFCEGGSVNLTANYANDITWVSRATNTTVSAARTLTASTSGTYFLRYRDVSGCDFVSSDVPVLVNPLPLAPVVTNDKSTTFCSGDNTVLRAGTNNVNYRWNTTEQTQSINVTRSGDYFLNVTDQNGCVSPQSNRVSVIVNPTPAKPAIATSGPTVICADQQVVLTASPEAVYLWNNNQTTQALTIRQAGSYALRVRNGSGCTSVQSDVVNVTVNALPPTPIITSGKPTTFCDGDNTILTTSTPNARYNWSSGQSTQQIDVRRSGTFTLSITDQNNCTSLRSNTVVVTVNPTPVKPTITATGSTTFCADQRVTLTASTEDNYVWSSGQTSREIPVNQTGNYNLRVLNRFGCASPTSDAVSVLVYPLPAAPTVTALGRTTFCEGDQVTLTTNSPLNMAWTSGETTPTLSVRKSGSYATRARDRNGCVSLLSNAVLVDVKPLPAAPVIQQIGTYTLEAVTPNVTSAYSWTRGTDSLSVNLPVIKANQSGNYAVRAYIVYNPTLTCISAQSPLFNFIADPDNKGLSIYPNPTVDKRVTIETQENLENAIISVYTYLGQEVLSVSVPVFDDRKRLDLTNLAPGQYLIQIRSSGFNVTKRMLIGL